MTQQQGAEAAGPSGASVEEHAADGTGDGWVSAKPKGRGYFGAGQSREKARMSADRALALEREVRVDGLAETLMAPCVQRLLQQCDFVGVAPRDVAILDGQLPGLHRRDLLNNQYGDQAFFLPRQASSHHAANLLLYMSGDNLLMRRESDKPLLVGRQTTPADDQSSFTGG